MRIIHLITRLIVGGAQENTILTCEGLHARGHDVYLFAGSTTGPEGSLVERACSGGYAYEEFPDLIRAVRPLRDSAALRALRRRFRELAPDVVHTHSSKAGVLGRVAAHQARVPHVVHTIHGMSFNRTQPAWLRCAYAYTERYCARRCHKIVSVADAMTAQALRAGIGRPNQFTTIRSGVDVDCFDPASADGAQSRASWGIRPDEIVIGTVARLFVNKGYEQLIEIMDVGRRLSAGAYTSNFRFLWIGDGADRPRYEKELERRGLRDRVVMTGLVPPAGMPRMLSTIDILAHTSQWEGLPRAAVQALLMERPVVSFDIDGAPEVILPGETGELVHLGDTEGFAAALASLANDPDRRRRYGRAGRSRCLAEFDHRTMVDRLDALYAQLAADRGA